MKIPKKTLLQNKNNDQEKENYNNKSLQTSSSHLKLQVKPHMS